MFNLLKEFLQMLVIVVVILSFGIGGAILTLVMGGLGHYLLGFVGGFVFAIIGLALAVFIMMKLNEKFGDKLLL